MKLLFVGDLHIRGDNPRNRIGNYFEDCKTKLNEVFEIAERESAVIIQVGDFFNSPSTSISVVGEVASFLKEKPTSMHTIVGNHDIFAHNLSTLERTPLGLLLRLGYLRHVSALNGLSSEVEFEARNFDHTVDTDYSEYITPEHPGKLQILVVHGMMLEKPAPFKHSLIEEIANVTNADVIVAGHYHLPFVKLYKGKMFFNPGALMRMSATEDEINRTPQVVLLDCETLNAQAIPLKCAKSGNEVLDRTNIETTMERELNMAQFVASLEQSGEEKFMDLQEIMENIAKQENIDGLIIKEAIERLSKVREGTK